MTLPRASRVTRSALPVRSQRASKSGPGASRRAEQKSSAYRSSDNEATMRAHTRARASPRACHVYYRPRRVHSASNAAFFPSRRSLPLAKVARRTRFPEQPLLQLREAMTPRARVSRRSGFMCGARAPRSPANCDTHTCARGRGAHITRMPHTV